LHDYNFCVFVVLQLATYGRQAPTAML